MAKDNPRVRDALTVTISGETAQSHYPQPGPVKDQRQPVTWEVLEAFPEEFIGPIRAVAERTRVWVYLLADEGAGVEVVNAPLKKHHAPLRIPPKISA